MSDGFPEPAALITTVAEAGPVRQVIRPLRLNARGATGWLIAWLALPVIVGVIALVAGAGALVPFLIMLAAATAGLAFPFRVMTGMRIQVCERGLIVSVPFGRRGRFFVPYATIDPASVMTHPVPKRGGAYRYKYIATVTGKYPWPAMPDYVQAACPLRPRFSVGSPPYGQPLNVWGAPWSRHGISFRALHPVFASPWWRSRPAAGGHPPRDAWVTGAMLPLLRYPELVPVLVHEDQPVMRWMLGTDRPEELLAAIEAAMVAAGVPGADGFTARALAHPYDRPPRDIPDDPQLW